MVVGEFAAFVVHARLVGELELGCWTDYRVGYGFATDGIDHFGVVHFYDTVCRGVEIEVGGAGYGMGADFIGYTEGVKFRMRFRRYCFLVLNCRVAISIDCRVNPQRENMLMRWCHHPR